MELAILVSIATKKFDKRTLSAKQNARAYRYARALLSKRAMNHALGLGDQRHTQTSGEAGARV